jgi:hypothetical protein
MTNGECKCKSNVGGKLCDQCIDNAWGYNSGNGCEECDCDPTGSKSLQCNSKNGLCKCKPGVGGKHCDQCLPGHWNFTESGCTMCQCTSGSTQTSQTGGYSCDATTGQCKCIQGVRGKTCGECDARWVLVNNVGCKKCDACVNTLLDEIDEIVEKFNEAEYYYSNLNDSQLMRKLSVFEDMQRKYEFLANAIGVDKFDMIDFMHTVGNLRQNLGDLVKLTATNFTVKIRMFDELEHEASRLLKEQLITLKNYKDLDDILEDLNRERSSAAITNYELSNYISIVNKIKQNVNTRILNGKLTSEIFSLYSKCNFC